MSTPSTRSSRSREWAVTAGARRDGYKQMDLVPTAHGPLAILAEPQAEEPDSSRDTDRTIHTILASLDSKTGTVRWFRTVSPLVDTRYAYDSESWVYSTWHKPDATSVSADGEYVALRLEMQPSQTDPPDSPRWNADHPQKHTILILSTKTGEVVRTVEVSGVLLGQALTNNDLLVQTSSTFRPEAGEITTYPLSSPKASGSSWRSTNWLVGATARGALLSTTPPGISCGPNKCILTTVTLNDPSTGTVQQTYDRVTRFLPAGGLVRLADGQALPAARDDAAWNAARQELIDLHSGTTINVSNPQIDTAVTPTGQAWLFYETEDQREKKQPPTSWLPMNDTSTTPRTEDLEVVTLTREEGFKDSTVHIERTTLTMGSGG
ncbi:hypothetical protein [Actinomyces slackii]|uniref:hypothetical protein n=1 Tax=Actinomyces slackii TaxID=52774 RepID=UPI000F83AD26|nr:hypothetical protein [Actinomyces slackii]